MNNKGNHMFSIKSKIMKKVIYFFTIGLIFTSCNLSKPIYDDVYDTPKYEATSKVNSENGYADLIQKEEHKYKVEPEEEHYSTIKVGSQTQNGAFSTSQSNQNLYLTTNQNFYLCAYHNYYHSHLTDDFMCREMGHISTGYSSSYYNPYNGNIYNQYGYNPYSTTNYYGSTYGYGYNSYNNGYSPYNSYWGNYGNSDPYSNTYFTTTTNVDNTAIASNTNHHYGHRNGTHHGTRSNNTTSFPNTVKASSYRPANNTNFTNAEAINQKPSIKPTSTITSKRRSTPKYSSSKPATNKFIRPNRPNTINSGTIPKTNAPKRTGYANKYKPSNRPTTNSPNRTTPTTNRRTTGTTKPSTSKPSSHRTTPSRSSSSHRGGSTTKGSSSSSSSSNGGSSSGSKGGTRR